MKPIATLILTFIISVQLKAQVPSTEIYLIDLGKDKAKPVFGTPMNISNNSGYDNQPHFAPNSDKLLYVSMRDTIQTDVYEYLISKKHTTMLAQTPQSEYSPVYAHGGEKVTIVRVDDDKGQRLYEFDGSPLSAELIVHGIDSVGYYCHVDDTTIALAVLNNGMDLLIYETTTSQFIIGANGIGRCLLKHPVTNELIFTIKSPDGKVSLMIFDLETGIKKHYRDGLDGVEDYVFTSAGNLWAGKEGKLYSLAFDSENDWKEIADFSGSTGPFYRMALSPDGRYLALVAFKGERP